MCLECGAKYCDCEASDTAAPGAGDRWRWTAAAMATTTTLAAPAPTPTAGGARGTAATLRELQALTPKQLRETIAQIYDSKVKFDAKCADAHLPRETMEQHMYTFLNQRYGLKPLIIEHASAIIKAVNAHGAADNDVAVFGKVLRNEVDEEFHRVQEQLKETVARDSWIFM